MELSEAQWEEEILQAGTRVAMALATVPRLRGTATIDILNRHTYLITLAVKLRLTADEIVQMVWESENLGPVLGPGLSLPEIRGQWSQKGGPKHGQA